mgnify:CR=1 FL=1
MSGRVDKQWQSKGLDTFSTEAILGTLAHYGVPMTEAGFIALAAERFPVRIASEWTHEWKGTGQFKPFPFAAADELWRRLLPGTPHSGDVIIALERLMEALAGALHGQRDDGTLETRFKVVEAYLAARPPERVVDFSWDVLAGLGDEGQDIFDELAELLAEKGLDELAERFVRIEESLLPERVGVTRACMQAAKGDEPGAITALTELAKHGALGVRVEAIDRLMDLDELHLAADAALAAQPDFKGDEVSAPDLVELMLVLAREADDEALAKRLSAAAEALLDAIGAV